MIEQHLEVVDLDVAIDVVEHDSVVDGMLRSIAGADDVLLVIGASLESRIRNVLFGSVPDLVAERAPSSVLMVHRHAPDHWSEGLGRRLKRMRAVLRAETSPDDPG